MTTNANERHVLLNHLVSRSTARTAAEHQPPLHSGKELLDLLEARWLKKQAIEFFGSVDDDDDSKRITKGTGHNLVRIRNYKYQEIDDDRYVTILFEYIDSSVTSMPVVDIESFDGREISGAEFERGATAAHVMIKLKRTGSYDDGRYRCAIEYIAPITRGVLETFISRQIRRATKEWTFTVKRPGKRKEFLQSEYRYTPRLELFADMGRKLDLALGEGRQLDRLVFTKRHERQEIAKETEVMHDDVFADLEIRISGKQAPVDPNERGTWLGSLREIYEKRGYDTKIYYRNVGGSIVSGDLHNELGGALDLVLCPRETIYLEEPPKKWLATICPDTENKLKTLLDRDGLWVRAK